MRFIGIVVNITQDLQVSFLECLRHQTKKWLFKPNRFPEHPPVCHWSNKQIAPPQSYVIGSGSVAGLVTIPI